MKQTNLFNFLSLSLFVHAVYAVNRSKQPSHTSVGAVMNVDDKDGKSFFCTFTASSENNKNVPCAYSFGIMQLQKNVTLTFTATEGGRESTQNSSLTKCPIRYDIIYVACKSSKSKNRLENRFITHVVQGVQKRFSMMEIPLYCSLEKRHLAFLSNKN